MHVHHLFGVLVLAIVSLSGCNSGGGGGGASTGTPATTTVMVKSYYDSPANTLLEAEGLVVVGADGMPTDIKHGWWKRYFPPADGNGLQEELIYVNGTWNQLDFWTRYNADSSIQDAMIDDLY